MKKNHIIIDEYYSINELIKHSQLDLTSDEATIHVKGFINPDGLKQVLDIEQYLQIGVDEAGRGPLLGSVVVGAVVLPKALTGELELIDLTNTALAKLNDSKKISEKKRDGLYIELQKHALACIAVDLPEKVIDQVNILQASLQGMSLATQVILKYLAQQFPKLVAKTTIDVWFDGNQLPKLDTDLYQKFGYQLDKIKPLAVVKGDTKYTSIASASIIAKVDRDQKMYQIAKLYPDYGIENHKGYPTKAHFEALEKYGVLPEHRRSFAPIRRQLDREHK